jgi:hypothetical protein
MSLVPVKYPLDLKGNAATNKAENELYVLAAGNLRVLVPRNGAFYTETIRLVDATTNRELIKGVDYKPTLLYLTPSRQTGLEVHQMLVVTDTTASSNLLFTCQYLGGEYSYCYDAIVQMIEALHLDDREVWFNNIIGLPDSWPPAPHLHDAGDIYGFEYLVAAIERLRVAVQLGSAPATKSFLDYVDNQVAQVAADVAAIQANIGDPATIIEALGFTPMDSAGGKFTGAVEFDGGLTNYGFYREKIKRINTTSNVTMLPIAAATVFDVSLSQTTTIKFDMANIPALQGDDSLSFMVRVKNTVAGLALAFDSNIEWADKAIPQRTTALNGKDEYYFTTFDGGASWTGSLSNENTGNAV